MVLGRPVKNSGFPWLVRPVHKGLSKWQFFVRFYQVRRLADGCEGLWFAAAKPDGLRKNARKCQSFYNLGSLPSPRKTVVCCGPHK